jgi:predicted nucleic-acid-binding Zn-ribbon protein
MKLLILCLSLSLASATLVVNPFGDEGACGPDQPRYINTSIFFMSPNFGNGSYPPNSDCTWLIEYTGDDEETSVEVNFNEFVLEDCTDCNCDYVEAFEGSSVEDPSLGRRCGNSADSFASEGTLMLVRFVSDASTEFGGFRASNEYDILPPPHCTSGGSPIVITDPEGRITSPNYGNGFYQNDLNCQWQISVPGATGYILEFDDEFGTETCCTCDYLQIHSGTGESIVNDIKRGRWYGNHHPHIFEMEGGDLYVRFTTDSSGTDIGFGFNFRTLQ